VTLQAWASASAGGGVAAKIGAVTLKYQQTATSLGDIGDVGQTLHRGH